MSGRMNIQSTYLNRVFRGLSFDMSHDRKHFFQYFGGLPPWRGGSGCPPPEKFFQIMRIKVSTIVHAKNHLPVLILSPNPFGGLPSPPSYPLTLLGGYPPPPRGVQSGPPQKLNEHNRHIWIEFFEGFHLICHMTQNIFFNILGGLPPTGGVQGGPPSKILLD